MSLRLRAMVPFERLGSPIGIATVGFVAAVIVLLADNPGLAIVIASLVIPAVVLIELPKRDVFEIEPKWSSPAMLGWGAVIGIIAATLGAVIAAEWWIEGAPLHVGAAGFGGESADRAGAPGIGVLLMNGIVLAAAGIAVTAVGPYAMRRYPIFRNEVMDGITLGVAAGCGFATGTTIVFVWPMISGGHPRGASVADWTALLLGVLVTRPIIFGLTAGFLCAGLWHVTISQRSFDLMLPAAIGIGSAIVFAFGDLLVQSSGTRPELLWHVVIAGALAAAAKIYFRRAITEDRATNGAAARRIVCPNCGSSTPAGAFCAVCGTALNAATDTQATTPIEIISAENGNAVTVDKSPDADR